MSATLNSTGISFSDGTSQITAAPAGTTILINSTTTWTVPTGVTKCTVTVIGGGGGGSAQLSGSSYTDRHRSGGSGGQATAFISGLTPGSNISVTVGSGGAGAGSSSGSGANGGTSSFGTYISATGGTGGVCNGVHGSPGTGSVASSGSVTVTLLSKVSGGVYHGESQFYAPNYVGQAAPGGSGFNGQGGGGGADYRHVTNQNPYGFGAGHTETRGGQGAAADGAKGVGGNNAGNTGGAGGGAAGGAGGSYSLLYTDGYGTGYYSGGGGGGGSGGVIIEY